MHLENQIVAKGSMEEDPQVPFPLKVVSPTVRFLPFWTDRKDWPEGHTPYSTPHPPFQKMSRPVLEIYHDCSTESHP